jgi:hypothetical protein
VTDLGNSAPTPGIGSTFTAFGEVVALLARSEVHTMMPCEVIAYYAPTGIAPERSPALVDVRPHFKYRRSINVPGDAEPGEEVIKRTDEYQARGDLPIITRVPIAYPGHDGMRASGPISVGQVGMIFFAERSIDDWAQTGGPVDPVFDNQWHHLSDAIFVPGARYGSIAEDIDPSLDRVGSADGTAGMEISTGPAASRTITLRTDGPTATVDAATEVKLGETATDAIALQPALVTAMDAAIAAAIAGAVINDGGKAAFTVFQSTWNGLKANIASLKGKA